MPTYTIRYISRDDARQIITWQYEPPYDIYNIGADDLNEEIDYYCDPLNQYYSVYADDTLSGFACFGPEGCVPGGDYSAEALDVGVGMRPDTTGQGNGAAYAQAVFDFAMKIFNPEAFRATVAEFNKRSQKVLLKHNFELVETFESTNNGKPYSIFYKSLKDT